MVDAASLGFDLVSLLERMKDARLVFKPGDAAPSVRWNAAAGLQLRVCLRNRRTVAKWARALTLPVPVEAIHDGWVTQSGTRLPAERVWSTYGAVTPPARYAHYNPTPVYLWCSEDVEPAQ